MFSTASYFIPSCSYLHTCVKIPYNLTWNPTQPDNGKGAGEACLSLQRFQGKYAFNDYFCSINETVFICQKTQLFHGCF